MIALVLIFPRVGSAQPLPRTLVWSELAKAGKLEAGRVVSDGGREALEIENDTPAPKTIRITVIEDPGITSTVWSLRGQVRYEGVVGRSYLELLNTLGGDSVYFTRSLAERGPMQHLEGTSAGRPFVLPFYSMPDAPKPTRVTFSIAFMGRGKVWLSDVVLNQHARNENPLAVGGGWWSERAGGHIGAILGSVLGLMGAVVGVLAGSGRARRFALGLMSAALACGLVLLVIGFVALFRSQPWHVYYPFMLAGALATLVFGGLFQSVRRRYLELELRKMSAVDSFKAS